MDTFGLFFGAAKRRLVWKTAETQPQGQTHAVFVERLCAIQHEFQVGFRDVHGGHWQGCNYHGEHRNKCLQYFSHTSGVALGMEMLVCGSVHLFGSD